MPGHVVQGRRVERDKKTHKDAASRPRKTTGKETGVVGRRYAIQGRLVERKANGKILRDDVQLARATDRATAFELANAMVAAKFTTWVFEVSSQAGRESYELLQVLPPT